MPLPARTDGEFATPTAASIRASRQLNPRGSAAPVSLIVHLSTGSLPSNLPDSAKLFVYLRAPGERMPIAVKHFPANAIPATVNFYSDSALDLVEVVARLSLSGQVERDPSDIEAVSIASLGHPLPQVSLEPGQANTPSQKVERIAKPGSGEKTKSTGVSISYAINDALLNEESVVFLVASQPGRRMPIAAKKLSFSQLPLRIELTDQDSMLPTHKLSDTKEIRYSAHISVAGTALRQKGDWVSAPATTNSSGEVALVIDNILN